MLVALLIKLNVNKQNLIIFVLSKQSKTLLKYS
jgi:hypothetical protein